MNIFHLSAECYPAAKVGGLADVVGSLPKYLCRQGVKASVMIPKYRTDWIQNQQFETVFSGETLLGGTPFSFEVQKEKADDLGFPFYVIDIPDRFDRPGIYGDLQSGKAYEDDAERFFSFQIAALEWVNSLPEEPNIIHCHDHHTALIPFMMTQCRRFKSLRDIPTIVTVHNAEYQGIYSHKKQKLLPDFDETNAGLLDWDGCLNCLATGLKCCWHISTVSPTYMKELRQQSNGLEQLFTHEKQKSRGILNGIDETVWNPETDTYLSHNYSVETLEEGKRVNKIELCSQFNFVSDRPVISFIGRLVEQKGADLLPDLFSMLIEKGTDANFIILGTGNPELHNRFRKMSDDYVGFFDASLHYNEKLAHQIYAGSDFMMMPSRFEPCGLNQLYAMQYGTIPIVREVGGLKDTVVDIAKPHGYGFTFRNFTLEAAGGAIERALKLYRDENAVYVLRQKIMKLDYSWNTSAQKYIEMYQQLGYETYG